MSQFTMNTFSNDDCVDALKQIDMFNRKFPTPLPCCCCHNTVVTKVSPVSGSQLNYIQTCPLKVTPVGQEEKCHSTQKAIGPILKDFATSHLG